MVGCTYSVLQRWLLLTCLGERGEIKSWFGFWFFYFMGFCFMPPDGDFLLWMRVMRGKFNSTRAPSNLSKWKTYITRKGERLKGKVFTKPREIWDSSTTWDLGPDLVNKLNICLMLIVSWGFFFLVKDTLKCFDGPENWIRSNVVNAQLGVEVLPVIWWGSTVVSTAWKKREENKIYIFLIVG